MFLTIVYYFLAIMGYFAIGVIYYTGVAKIVNADRWDHINNKKDISMKPLSHDWENRKYLDVILYLMFWPVWIFGGIFVMGLIGNDK